MKNLVNLLFVICFFTLLTNCKKEEPIKVDPTEINSLFNSAQSYSEPPESSDVATGSTTTSQIEQNGIQYNVKTTPYKVTAKNNSYQPVGQSTKKSGSSGIYPGAIVQGKYWFENGELVSYGDFTNRKDMTITVKGVDLGAGNSSRTVYPSNSEMENALQEMFAGQTNLQGTQDWIFQKTQTYSKKQSLLSLGLKANWVVAGFDANFSYNTSVEKNTMLIYFRQNYFTVSTNEPPSPADFFNSNVDIDILKQKITPDNPAGFVSTITYGRVLVAEMSSTSSYEKMEAALNAKFTGLGGAWNPSVTYEQEQLLQNSDYKISVYGGPVQNVPQTYEGILNFINNGMNVGQYTNAVPVSYTVKYMKDLRTFNIGDSENYNRIVYEEIPAEMQEFDVYILGFYVWNDGDFWSAGDFTYNLKLDWNTDSWTKNLVVEAESGSWIYVDQTITFSLPKRQNTSFKITGSIKEDENLLGNISKTFSYPWNDADLNPNTLTLNGVSYPVYSQYLKYSSDLDVTFYMQTVKKGQKNIQLIEKNKTH